MISQKDISFNVISLLRNQGMDNDQIVLLGSKILLDEYRKGSWGIKKEGYDSDNSILKYSRDLLKNWIKKDLRLNNGEKYSPRNPRIKKEMSIEDQERMMWESRKVG